MRKVLRWPGLLAGPLIALAVAACAGSPQAATEARDAGPPSAQTAAPDAGGPAPRPAAPGPSAGQDLERELREARFDTHGWKTDFQKRSVPLKEIFPGGPPRDGIPAIDRPAFIGIAEASQWLKDREPVVAVFLGGEAKAYPLQVLMWHEIVNDAVGRRPVAVTYCPLCNTAIAFDRTLDGRVLDFGTTGNLRFSDLVMYDRQTESWWQQITGEAIVGELTGKSLAFLPSSIVSWGEFKGAHPGGLVLSRETGYSRPYGENPYVGYDSSGPFLYRGPTPDGRLPAMERVATVTLGEQDVAFPFSVLREHPVVHYTVGGKDIVVLYKAGAASALDSGDIAGARDVGATGVFERHADSRKLTFRWDRDRIVDAETGSAWNLLGEAVEGPLLGKRLTPVVHGNHFWFAWAVFKPRTVVYRP